MDLESALEALLDEEGIQGVDAMPILMFLMLRQGLGLQQGPHGSRRAPPRLHPAVPGSHGCPASDTKQAPVLVRASRGVAS